MVQYAFATSLIFTLALVLAEPRRLSAEQSETDKSMSDKITIRIVGLIRFSGRFH